MVSQQLVDIIIKAEDQASAAAKKVDESLQKIKSSSSALSKIPGFDTLKTQLSGVAQTIDTKLGGALTKAKTHFTNFRTSVSETASSIKTTLGGAVDSVRSKLQSFTNGTNGMSSALGFLRSAASMTVGMIGFDLVNSFMNAGRAAINAQSQLEYFGQRLNMSGQETAKFNAYLDDMQKQFRKVDMTAVGAAAEEMAVKLKLPKSSLEELTKATAVLSSAFVKEGRTQEDAILAVSDALDGQFKRLQELGITQDMLKNNGWNGDLQDKDSLLKAINKTLDDMGFTDTAKDITNLDEAFQALSVAGGDLLAKILVPITPALVSITQGLIGVMDGFGSFIGMLQGAWDALPDWLTDTAWAAALAVVLKYFPSIYIGTTSNFLYFISSTSLHVPHFKLSTLSKKGSSI